MRRRLVQVPRPATSVGLSGVPSVRPARWWKALVPGGLEPFERNRQARPRRGQQRASRSSRAWRLREAAGGGCLGRRETGRTLLGGALTAIALLAAGCGSGTPPEVTFSAADTSVTARPTQYCDLKLTKCSDDAGAPVRLVVPAGTSLRVAVPDDVAEAPWHVVFSYRNEGGDQIDARSQLFPADQQHEYTLMLPEPADRLVTAQVQQFGPAPQINEQTGELEFPVRGSWVLNATAT